jgi:hypothetical protein
MKWILSIILGGMGLSMLLAGLGWGYKRLELYNNGISTTGRVVKNIDFTKKDNKSIPSKTYYPLVEFTSPDGKIYQFRGNTGSGIAEYEVGASVNIIYNPVTPSEAQIANFSEFLEGPLVITIFSFAFLGSGILSFNLLNNSAKTLGKMSNFKNRLP